MESQIVGVISKIRNKKRGYRPSSSLELNDRKTSQWALNNEMKSLEIAHTYF